VEQLGGVVDAAVFLIELAYIHGRQNLKHDVISAIVLRD